MLRAASLAALSLLAALVGGLRRWRRRRRRRPGLGRSRPSATLYIEVVVRPDGRGARRRRSTRARQGPATDDPSGKVRSWSTGVRQGRPRTSTTTRTSSRGSATAPACGSTLAARRAGRSEWRRRSSRTTDAGRARWTRSQHECDRQRKLDEALVFAAPTTRSTRTARRRRHRRATSSSSAAEPEFKRTRRRGEGRLAGRRRPLQARRGEARRRAGSAHFYLDLKRGLRRSRCRASRATRRSSGSCRRSCRSASSAAAASGSFTADGDRLALDVSLEGFNSTALGGARRLSGGTTLADQGAAGRQLGGVRRSQVRPVAEDAARPVRRRLRRRRRACAAPAAVRDRPRRATSSAGSATSRSSCAADSVAALGGGAVIEVTDSRQAPRTAFGKLVGLAAARPAASTRSRSRSRAPKTAFAVAGRDHGAEADRARARRRPGRDRATAPKPPSRRSPRQQARRARRCTPRPSRALGDDLTPACCSRRCRRSCRSSTRPRRRRPGLRKARRTSEPTT